MATSDCFASAAAEPISAPESNCTLAPGTFALTACRGDVGNQTCSIHREGGLPGGSTCAEPPPEIMPVPALGPMIAIEWICARSSGRRLCEFFNNTVLC